MVIPARSADSAGRRSRSARSVGSSTGPDNLGFNGIAVALLGRLDPFGALVAAIALGALAAAGPTVQLFIDVPLDVIRSSRGRS